MSFLHASVNYCTFRHVKARSVDPSCLHIPKVQAEVRAVWAEWMKGYFEFDTSFRSEYLANDSTKEHRRQPYANQEVIPHGGQ